MNPYEYVNILGWPKIEKKQEEFESIRNLITFLKFMI